MGWLTKMAIQWGVEKAYTAGKIEISVIESNREILNNIAKEKDTVKKYDKAKTKKEKKRLVNDLTKDGIGPLSLFSLGCATHVPTLRLVAGFPRGKEPFVLPSSQKRSHITQRSRLKRRLTRTGTRFLTPENFGMIKAAFKECVIRKHCKIVGEKKNGTTTSRY